MGNSDDIKIRTVPRSNEKAADGKMAEKPAVKKGRRFIIYVARACLILVGVGGLFLHLKSRSPTQAKSSPPKQGQTDLASINARINESVTRHLQDAEIKRSMMMQERELENEQFKGASQEPNIDDIATLPDNRSYGVQLDGEDVSARVYEDLNNEPSQYSDTLPADRINARLAKRKWLNEQERAEKIQFVSAYIRSAYERGYEVEIDKDLVVVGVRRITSPQKVNINQVIDRLAKEGY